MVFTNDGLNRIRDLLANDINKGMVGTGTSSESVSDSSLDNGLSGTEYTVTITKSDKQLVADYNLPSTAGNGSSITEFGLFNSDDLLFSRFVFSSLVKEDTEQWQFSTRIRVL